MTQRLERLVALALAHDGQGLTTAGSGRSLAITGSPRSSQGQPLLDKWVRAVQSHM